ncbi:MAG: Methyltransferase type 11 [Gammaproteobacteria bacterium]|nr:Methyltransferase type 11 [Gammaproteobacteria bacterium]
MDQQELSVTQFGASATQYLTSTVHATGADLERLKTIAGQLRPARVLDLGCGAGHASFALARGGARQVTAFDPSSDMLGVVAKEAAARGYDAIETCVGVAEALPFESNTFDLVVTRYSAHHWANVPRALAECARVIAPGGRLVVIDVIAPEKPLFDTSLQVIEFLRDASHVRDYRVPEWVAMQQAAGFAEPEVACWKLPLDFKSWIARIGTPPARVAALQTVFAALPGEVLEYFQIGPELSFVTDSAWLEALKAD